ncbi:hypothetical protein BUALT_Bualt14G0011300 [Buddleja alternifolia]|uniref:Uncharacterized protein n=1 Tax=Buddleja alternifolia TaxID=168488 RepID=A0AAV6WNI9_9LAMI|nr:hypothetical protein BUALT_Bualt14G0011300 [Buddleja alternifolia]
MLSQEGKVFILKGVQRKDLELAECAMEGLSDRTSGGGLPKARGLVTTAVRALSHMDSSMCSLASDPEMWII